MINAKYSKVLTTLIFITLLSGCNKNSALVNKSGNFTVAKMVEGKMTMESYKKTIKNPAALFEGMKVSTSYKTMENHNPIMTQRFGADPFAMVYGDRIYVYMTNDTVQKDSNGAIQKNVYGKIQTLNCISSEDLVNWTDHGLIQVTGSNGLSKWSSNSWAPAAAHKTINGKEQFFIYYANNGNGIGVLSSDSPVGPFVDPIQKPLVSRDTPNCSDITWLFDPAVFVDDNGKAYLYFGGGVPEGKDEMPRTGRAVELGEDMISLACTPINIEAPYMFEDSGINRIGDTYYYSYCSNWADRLKATGKYVPDKATIAYMTSKNPLGPWEYQGTILNNPGSFFGSYATNHHCLTKFKDKFYMFYHSQVLEEAMGLKGYGYRCTHIDEVKINEDGSINKILGTKSGVGQLKSINPYEVVEAESLAVIAGATTIKCNENSEKFGAVNMAVSTNTQGSYIGVANVDFGKEGCKKFTAKVSSEFAGNVIKICLDNLNGEAIGYLEVPNTDSKDAYVNVTVDVEKVRDVHNLYLVFAGNGCQIDSWKFEN